MGIIHIARMLAHRMVTGALHGLWAVCSSAPDPGITSITAIPVIGRSMEVAGGMGTTIMAITLALIDMAATAMATTAVPTGTEE